MNAPSGPRHELSEQVFWDSVSAQRLRRDDAWGAPQSRLGAWLASLTRDHYWVMLEGLCARYIAQDASKSMLEIGCAPGQKLLWIHDVIGFRPYGLEYAPAGVEDCRRVFQHRGFDPSHVFLGDLFDAQTKERHGARYDLVMSFGFIEHFSDPTEAIRCHADLVAPGGYLLIHIPNVVGINRLTMRLFRPGFVDKHNLSIMHPARFRKLFAPLNMRQIFCGHVGFLKLYGLFTQRERSFRGAAARAADKVQMLLNVAMRLAFLGRDVTWSQSPCLVYLGQKPPLPALQSSSEVGPPAAQAT